MEAQARPQDLLLAYDPGFVGYTSLTEMARPLEQAGDLATLAAPSATGTLGGTADPDGYYDDFTARLDRFVRAHPRLGAVAGGASRPLDWKALVVTLDDEYDRDDDYDYDESLGETGGPEGDSLEGDGLGGDSLEDSGIEDSGLENSGLEGGGGDPAEAAPAVISLQDFIVEVDGGLAARRAAPGEMDESAAEDGGYPAGSGAEARGGGSRATLPSPRSSQKKVSLLDYSVDR